MVRSQNREDYVYAAVERGLLEIRDDGTVWKIGDERGNRWNEKFSRKPCVPRRAENLARRYLQVRWMTNGVRYHALAHRLVFRHFNGPIPDGLTINHINGIKTDNRPENLELATPSEQARHAIDVLGHKRDQDGAKNAMAKLTENDVHAIRARRANGEPLKSIAADYGVSDRCISKIALGQRWRGARGPSTGSA